MEVSGLCSENLPPPPLLWSKRENSQVQFLRKIYGSRLNAFAPVHDLSALSKSSSEVRSLVRGQKSDVAIAGGQILGDEYSDHVVKVRAYTALERTASQLMGFASV